MRMAYWITLLSLTVSSLSASDWPQWRGPNQNGTTDETNLPASLDPNTLLWKNPLPGPGEATPVISNGCIYLSGYNKEIKQLFAFCLDAKTGRQLWENNTSTSEKLPRGNIINGQTQLLLFGGNYLTGHDLSTGEERW